MGEMRTLGEPLELSQAGIAQSAEATHTQVFQVSEIEKRSHPGVLDSRCLELDRLE